MEEAIRGINQRLDKVEEKLDEILALLDPERYASPIDTNNAQWDGTTTITYPYTLEELDVRHGD